MAAYRRVYDSHHLQANCQEPGSAPEPYTLGNRVWATFTFLLSTRPRVGVKKVGPQTHDHNSVKSEPI